MSIVPDVIRTCGSGTTKCTRMVQCCPKNRVDPRIRWIPMVDHHISSLSPDSPVKTSINWGSAYVDSCTSEVHKSLPRYSHSTSPGDTASQAGFPGAFQNLIILHHSLHHSQFFCIILSILLHRHSQIPQNFQFSKSGVRLHRPGARIDRSQHLRLAADPWDYSTRVSFAS